MSNKLTKIAKELTKRFHQENYLQENDLQNADNHTGSIGTNRLMIDASLKLENVLSEDFLRANLINKQKMQVPLIEIPLYRQEDKYNRTGIPTHIRWSVPIIGSFSFGGAVFVGLSLLYHLLYHIIDKLISDNIKGILTAISLVIAVITFIVFIIIYARYFDKRIKQINAASPEKIFLLENSDT